MTNITERFNQQAWLSGVVSLLLFLLLMVGVIVPVWGNQDPNTVSSITANTTDLGIALVSGNGYVLPFEVASLLLTAAMIGAVAIARGED
jgi:NADH:ubiquinone oxidoreductase subunit 6 (subunit J)